MDDMGAAAADCGTADGPEAGVNLRPDLAPERDRGLAAESPLPMALRAEAC